MNIDVNTSGAPTHEVLVLTLAFGKGVMLIIEAPIMRQELFNMIRDDEVLSWSSLSKPCHISHIY